MDANQIRLYVQQNIQPTETDTRILAELKLFIEALVLQESTLGRAPTTTQINASWIHWKTERFHLTEQIKQYSIANAKDIEQSALEQINKSDENIKNSEMLAHEAPIFAAAYGRELSHLGRPPLPDHINLAWKNWKAGHRW